MTKKSSLTISLESFVTILRGHLGKSFQIVRREFFVLKLDCLRFNLGRSLNSLCDNLLSSLWFILIWVFLLFNISLCAISDRMKQITFLAKAHASSLKIPLHFLAPLRLNLFCQGPIVGILDLFWTF